MSITKLVASAFRLARHQHKLLLEENIKRSFRIGMLLPDSLLAVSIQRLGDLDLLVRSMKDDFAACIPAEPSNDNTHIDDFDHLCRLSELWVGGTYEIFRLLIVRNLRTDETTKEVHARLKLLRIPWEKYEIANERKLAGPLEMAQISTENSVHHWYEQSDKKRSHIMPSGITAQGSVAWLAVDALNREQLWIERLALSNEVNRAYDLAF